MTFLHQFISDVDCALACGDVLYLVKLLSYCLPEKRSQVFNLKKTPIEYVNCETLYKKFGEGLTNFYKDCDKLPRLPCISCERLIIRDPYYLKEINASWKHIHNTAYKTCYHTLTVMRGFLKEKNQNMTVSSGYTFARAAVTTLIKIRFHPVQ